MTMKKKDRYELDKICAYCERATPLAGGEHVLCEKKGVVAESYHCRKFVYDPTKRIPKRAKPLPESELDAAEAAKTPDDAPKPENSVPEAEENADADAESNEPKSGLPEMDLPKIDDII